MGATLLILGFVYFLSIVGEVWQRINEYEAMRSRGYTLMKNDKDDDFWVGYGDWPLNYGDTGMYQLDFVSVAFGYICGIILYASMSNIMYMEENNEDEWLRIVGGVFCSGVWLDVSPSPVRTYVETGRPREA